VVEQDIADLQRKIMDRLGEQGRWDENF